MKIVVVSDNHGRLEPLKDILMLHQDAEVFIHCGDSEMPAEYLSGYVSVKGNNDFYGDLPEYRIIDLNEYRILVTHGHRMMFLDNREMLVNKAKSLNCDIVCFGHTHVYENRIQDGIVLVNPGSLSRNRDGSQTSYAIITIEGNNIKTKRLEYKFGCKF